MNISDNQVFDSVLNQDKELNFNTINKIEKKDSSFKSSYLDRNLKTEYDALKTSTKDKYGIPPAAWIGYIEETPELWNDVKNASSETGVNPNLLYTIGMQEGFGSSHFWEFSTSKKDGNLTTKYIGDDSLGEIYENKQWVDTYSDIGLDTFFIEQDNLLEKGFLKNPIKPQDDFLFKTTNELGLPVKSGNVTKEDAWIATGALIRQNQDWMKNSFNNRNINWDKMDEKEKTFWTYASFNGGPGLATKLLDKYGSMDDIIKYRKTVTWEQAGGYTDNQKLEGHIRYIDNILRVTGGKDLLGVHNPFKYTEYE